VSDLLQFHHWLLSDRNRTCAYREAILRAVKKDDVVLDIGAGTGLLSFFACLAGARKVYAVEQTDAIEFGQEICAANGFGDRIEFVKERSQNVTLPEPVDIIVSDMGASFGLQGGMLGTLSDARKRFLKPTGQIIPESLDLLVAPIELGNARSLDIWNKNRYGLDLSAIRRFAANTNYHMVLEPGNVLGAAELLKTVQFHAQDASYVSGETRCVIERLGVMHGLGAWISVNLIPGVSFTNSPLHYAERTVDWTQSFFPIETPLSVEPGDSVKAKISTNNGQAWHWQVEITAREEAGARTPAVKARFDHSTLLSFPIRPEQLKKKLLDYAPRLSRKGEAESYVLGAFDGRRTMKEIAEELRVHFGDCFPTTSSAAEFIRKIVERTC
jgi:type I protein arginine methyltransferase